MEDRLKPIPVDAFNNHVERMHADRDRWFELEYSVSMLAVEAEGWQVCFQGGNRLYSSFVMSVEEMCICYGKTREPCLKSKAIECFAQ